MLKARSCSVCRDKVLCVSEAHLWDARPFEGGPQVLQQQVKVLHTQRGYLAQGKGDVLLPSMRGGLSGAVRERMILAQMLTSGTPSSLRDAPRCCSTRSKCSMRRLYSRTRR